MPRITVKGEFMEVCVGKTWVYGITLDSIANLPQIIDALKSFAEKPTVRIVFDEFVAAKDYLTAVNQISQVANIMGELLDSYYVSKYSQAQYEARAKEYLQILGDKVSVWEIGNEINGDWLKAGAAQKAYAAWKIFKAAGKKTALTTYYNCECEDSNGPMLPWVQKNIPADMKLGLDYVLISYYEDDCENRVVSLTEWETVFGQLTTMFPNAKVGMGECGSATAAKKAAYMTRYYSMRLKNPKFIGGFFWWYGTQDLVPKAKALWKTMNDLFALDI